MHRQTNKTPLKIISGIIAIIMIMFLQEALCAQNQYSRSAASPSEANIFMSTDRDVYIAGEVLYFSIKIRSSAVSQFTGNIVFTGLRNRENTTINSGIVRFRGNRTHGSLHLPDTLSTGFYEIFSFAGETRNAGGDDLAGKIIFVANRFDRELDNLDAARQNSGDAPDLLTSMSVNDQTPQTSSLLRLVSKSTRYGTREKVTIEIETTEAVRYPCRLAMSVVQKNSVLQGYNESTITFPGGGVQGGRSVATERSADENGGLYISGTVTSRAGGNPVAGAKIFLSRSDDLIYLLHSRTLEDGSFYFRLDDFPIRGSLLISMKDPEVHRNSLISLYDKFYVEEPFVHPVAFDASKLKDHLLKSQEIVGVNKMFDISLHRSQGEIQSWRIQRPLIVTRPYLTVDLDNYLPLNDLPDIVTEIIPVWRIRERGGETVSRLVDTQRGHVFDNPPAMFLNGIYISDIETLMDMGSDVLQKIDVFNYPVRYGNSEFPGVVSLYSREGIELNISDFELHIETEVPQIIPLSYYNPPVYATETDSSDPDFRQLLFWDPSITINDGQSVIIEFYTGDLKGDYIVKAEGITADGTTIYEQIIITVQ